ncbi:prevent-host-death protein [Candidatus Electrothrix sp.]|uniref:prevent-host-death protein n=1 Tax=Candidatus Electrothrix sp. TaxID=2170559 RepID=UPI004057683D
MEQVQYISNANSKITGVIVPIDLWQEIESERETVRLLRSENMKRRLLKAKNRKEGISLDEACTRLAI